MTAMTDTIWIRELSGDEIPDAQAVKTGDRLPDGSVLLWREDMDRMGLEALRSWIMQKVLEERATIAVGVEPGSSAVLTPLTDDVH
jgi:hypothetical protein